MSVESLWYTHVSRARSLGLDYPHTRRLCRLPLHDQWRATIDLAIAISDGTAGWRDAKNSITGERYWYWPTCPFAKAGDTGWWLIPARIETRARALVKVATHAAIRAGRGSCGPDDVTAQLRLWRQSGSWRRRAAAIVASAGNAGRREAKSLDYAEGLRSLARTDRRRQS